MTPEDTAQLMELRATLIKALISTEDMLMMPDERRACLPRDLRRRLWAMSKSGRGGVVASFDDV